MALSHISATEFNDPSSRGVHIVNGDIQMDADRAGLRLANTLKVNARLLVVLGRQINPAGSMQSIVKPVHRGCGTG